MKPKSRNIKINKQRLATLLEGAGLFFNIFECDFQKNYHLWSVKAVKLDKNDSHLSISAATIVGESKKGQLDIISIIIPIFSNYYI